MNYVKAYTDEITSGRIVACKRIKKIYQRLVNEIENDDLPFYFDESAGERPIIFIEKFCKQSEGKFGAPIELDLFQKAWIQALFGFKWKATDLRRFNESFFMVGRKNGKTTVLSAIALYMLIADNEGSAEIYCVATKKDQARKMFDSAAAMRFHSKAIAAITRKRRTDIYVPTTLSKYEALASDSNTLDGLNSHLVVIDELHAILQRALYEVMKQSMSSRKQPMLVMITTSGMVRESIFDDMYEYSTKVCDGVIKNDKFLPIIYELDHKDEWMEPDAWMKANPGLGTIKEIDYLKEMVQRAIDDKKMKKTVMCKDFNLRETATESWLDYDDVYNDSTFTLEELKGSYAVGGADLSSTTDLTCATLMIAKKGKKYIIQKYFMPNTVEQRSREDRVPYDQWRDAGWIHECDGVRVDYSDVTKWFVEMRDKYDINPLWVGFDRWNAQYWVEEMKSEGFIMEPVIQGAMTMSAPMKELEAEFKAKNINYNNTDILRWCLTNTTIAQDQNQNIRPVKGKNVKQRIDGTVSLIDAYVVYINHMSDYHAWNGGE